MERQCIVCKQRFVARQGGSPQKYCSICKEKAKGHIRTLQRWAKEPQKYNHYIAQNKSDIVILRCIVCDCPFERKRQGGQTPHYCSKCGKSKGTKEIRRLGNIRKKNFTARVRRLFGCSRCGYSSCVSALSFHHRNPLTKRFNLSRCSGRSMKSVKEEMRKCDILCENCHREVHHIGARSCRIPRMKRYVNRVLQKFGCQCCGYNQCIAALDFHHHDKSAKSFSLGTYSESKGISYLKSEMRKCIILCANCHREQECKISICFCDKETL